MKIVESKPIDGRTIYAHVAGILRICTGYGLYCSFVYEKMNKKTLRSTWPLREFFMFKSESNFKAIPRI
jgi:hypothetical protein